MNIADLPCKRKAAFPTPADALVQANRLNGFARWRGRVEHYKCPHCDAWHLTGKKDAHKEIAA